MQVSTASTDVFAVITERIKQLRALNPDHDLLRWDDVYVYQVDDFLQAFWDRPAPRERRTTEEVFHVTTRNYSRALGEAIDRLKHCH